MIDHYKTLGIERLATHKEIKEAGKLLKLQLQEAESTGIGKAAIKIQKAQIDEALTVLLDPEEREVYDLELDNAPESTIVDCTKPLRFNLGAIRTASKKSWRDVLEWDGEASLKVYRDLLRKTAKLPYPEIQEDMFLAAVLTPMPLAEMLPILFCYGTSGSGKSSLGKFAYTVYGNRPIVGATTYSAIRRKVEQMARAVDAGIEIDLLHCMVWDDISLRIMKSSPQMYSFIKSCYDRETAVIEMADRDSDTKVVKFRCFGMRVFSSTYPFHTDEDYDEMTRRSLIFETKKVKSCGGLLSYGFIDWKGFERIIHSIWEDPKHNGVYKTWHNRVVEYGQSEECSIASDRVSLCADVLTTGLVLGIWRTESDAFEALEAFYNSTDDLIKCGQSVVYQVIKRFVSEAEKEHKAKDRQYPIFIKPNELTQEIKKWQAQDVIDQPLRNGELAGIMRDLGWELNVRNAEWLKS
jgi:hypothetical protein